MKKGLARVPRGCRILIIIPGISVILFALIIAVMILSPAFMAQGSDVLRNVMGDAAVAKLESTVFQIQDTIEQWRYTVGLATPVAP